MSTSGRKAKKKPIKKINHTMKNKLSILFLCVLGALVVLLGVITYINFHSGEKYKKQVLSQAQQKYQNPSEAVSTTGMETFWQPATRYTM